jgi:hypothetical protein
MAEQTYQLIVNGKPVQVNAAPKTKTAKRCARASANKNPRGARN